MEFTVFDLVRAAKSNINCGPWKSGKIPAGSFPIRRPKSIPIGGDWRWRICEFDALGHHCRVLIRLNEPKQQYFAMLAIDTAKLTKVVCHHDLHVGDKGWHCHFAKGRISDVMEGVLRDFNTFRMRELSPSKACSQTFTVNEDNALTKAAQRYRFEDTGDFL